MTNNNLSQPKVDKLQMMLVCLLFIGVHMKF